MKAARAQDRETIEKQNQQLSDYEAEINLLRRRIEALEQERERDKKEIARLTDALNRARIVSYLHCLHFTSVHFVILTPLREYSPTTHPIYLKLRFYQTSTTDYNGFTIPSKITKYYTSCTFSSLCNNNNRLSQV